MYRKVCERKGGGCGICERKKDERELKNDVLLDQN